MENNRSAAFSLNGRPIKTTAGHLLAARSTTGIRPEHLGKYLSRQACASIPDVVTVADKSFKEATPFRRAGF